MRIFTTNSIFVFGAALFLLLSYQFISAQTWTNPPASPPSSNATAPLNVGSTAQTKNGDLTVNGRLNVNNDLTANDVVDVNSSLGANTINIFATGPTIRYVDSDNRDYWTHVNDSNFYVLIDRDQDGDWDSPHPLTIRANGNSDNDSVQINKVWGREYCDWNGNDCFSASGMPNMIQSGVATVPKGTGTGSRTVNFPRAFPSTPVVTFTPRWSGVTGDEGTSWWITNVSSTGFQVNYHGPDSPDYHYGQDNVMWIAVYSN